MADYIPNYGLSSNTGATFDLPGFMGLNSRGMNLDVPTNLGTQGYGPDSLNYSVPQNLLAEGYGANPSWLSSISKWGQDNGLLGKTLGDGTKVDGMLGPMAGVAQAGANMLLGLGNYRNTRDTLNFQKDAFNKNFGMQSALVRGDVEGRAAARYAANGYKGEAPKEYTDRVFKGVA